MRMPVPEWEGTLPAPWVSGHSLLICGDRHGVLSITFLSSSGDAVSEYGAAEACLAVAKLRSYLESGAWCFAGYPVPQGTPFQRRVWRALQGISPGSVLTYGALARQLGSSARAVANACRANPLPIIIPCHRVVAARGVGGYLGETVGEAIAIKRWLLHHEGHESASY